MLASHQCVPGSIPAPSVIGGLSLLLVLFGPLACSERFFSGYSGFPLTPKNRHFQIPIRNLEYCQALYHEPLVWVMAQALPVFDIKFTFTFLHLI